MLVLQRYRAFDNWTQREGCIFSRPVDMADVFRGLNLLENLKDSIESNKLSDVKDAVEDLLISRINLAVVEEVAGYPDPKHPDFRLWDLPPVPPTSPFEPKGYVDRVKFLRYSAAFMTFTQLPLPNSVEVFLEARSLQQQAVYFILLASEKDTEKSLHEKKKASMEVMSSQGVANAKVYLVRPSALEKFDFPGLLEEMSKDLPEIRAHALLLALPTFTSTLVSQKKEGIKALVWAAASLSGGDLSYSCSPDGIYGGLKHSMEVTKAEVKKRLAAAENDLATVSSKLLEMALPRYTRSVSRSFAAMLQALNGAIDEMALAPEKIVAVAAGERK
ncbi:hypothetical protein Q8A73_007630 [Channa argus]|nr:hypothetical protein Q8A73_007630 [Channa argus]